jgi:hypothetical protein
MYIQIVSLHVKFNKSWSFRSEPTHRQSLCGIPTLAMNRKTLLKPLGSGKKSVPASSLRKMKRIGLMVIAQYHCPPEFIAMDSYKYWNDVFERLNKSGLSVEDVRQIFDDGCKVGREIFRAIYEAPMQEFTIW